MTKSKKFVMKKKPSRPQRKIEDRSMALTVGESMQDLLDRLEDKSLDPGEVLFKQEWYSDNIILEYHELEEEAQYLARLGEWDMKLEDYLAWEKDNQEGIANRLKEDKEKKRDKIRERFIEIRENEERAERLATKERDKLTAQLGSL